MPASLSNGQSVTFAGATITEVTQASVSETAPTIDVTSLNQATGGYRELIPGLTDASEVSITSIGSAVGSVGATGSVSVGGVSFSKATVMTTEVAYRVGEVVAYTTTLRAIT